MLHVLAGKKVMSGDLTDGMTSGDLTFNKIAGGDVIIKVGESTFNSKTAVSVAGVKCPTKVDKSNWEGKETYGDSFDIVVHGNTVTATRTDNRQTDQRQSGWGMGLSFKCKAPDGWQIATSSSKAMVIAADVQASNGVAHLLDGVLLPPVAKPTKNIVQVAQSVPALSTLVTAVVKAGLDTTLSGTKTARSPSLPQPTTRSRK